MKLKPCVGPHIHLPIYLRKLRVTLVTSPFTPHQPGPCRQRPDIITLHFTISGITCIVIECLLAARLFNTKTVMDWMPSGRCACVCVCACVCLYVTVHRSLASICFPCSPIKPFSQIYFPAHINVCKGAKQFFSHAS